MTSVGYATILRAAAAVTGWDEETVRACAVAIGDLGEAVGLLRPAEADGGMTIAEADAFFRGLAGRRRPAEKREAIEEMLRRASAVEAKYLLKTLSGGLRIGADVTTVEEAIAQAFGRDREAVARARRDSGDVGETAAPRGPIASARSARLFHPIGFMLASPIESAERSPGSFRLRDRGQVRRHPRARSQGRREGRALLAHADDVTEQFPEIARGLADMESDGTLLLDGEIVAWQEDEDRPASFSTPAAAGPQGARRLAARGHPDRVRRLRLPGAERTAALRGELGGSAPRARGGGFRDLAAPLGGLRRPDPGGARGAVRRGARPRQRGPDAEAPGFALPGGQARPGLAQVEEGPRLDRRRGDRRGAGARQARRHALGLHLRGAGHGGRRVRQHRKATRALRREIRGLAARFRKSTIARYGPVRAVAPEVVIEVSFDSIQKSARHKSGFALRFPRILRLRPDRSPGDVTTLEEIRELYERLIGGTPANK